MPPLDVTTGVVAQASLADYTSAGLIVPRMSAFDTPGIIAELSHVLQRAGCVPDVLQLCHTALNQELLFSSALECGIAFPHARLSGVKRLQFALGCTKGPVVWGAKNSWPVRLVFLLAVPSTDAAPYLHLLATIARLGQQPEVLSRIYASETPAEAFNVLKKIRVR